jgi:hypothetical protein
MNGTVLGMGSNTSRRTDNIDIGNEAFEENVWLYT